MATNKHATIRYHALDRCFSNHGRSYFIEDLILACNEAIYEFAGIEDGVKRRQIFDDITFMESDQGWSIQLDRLKDGKRVYYRYTDKSFSIKKLGINQGEAEQLNETLAILSRFKGLPQFEWIEEMQIRLEGTFMLKGDLRATVGFEQNPFLKGLNYFTELFNSIRNQKVLMVKYQGYKQEHSIDLVLHPWYLKQYNNRWFLFGLNDEFKLLSNLALDRIISIKVSKVKYKENAEINFEEYFDDVVGVTVKNEGVIEKIILEVYNEVWPYIASKPLHGSQRVIQKLESHVLIELRLQLNHELFSLLFSYMDAIEVIEPLHLRDKFKIIADSIIKKYI